MKSKLVYFSPLFAFNIQFREVTFPGIHGKIKTDKRKIPNLYYIFESEPSVTTSAIYK